jgi:hypothetical protein
MGLTWRDLVSSLAVLAIILAWWSYESRVGLPLVSSAGATSVVVLVLGICCALAAASDLHTTPLSGAGLIFRRVTTVCGTIALVAGLAGALLGSAYALELLVVFTIVLWTTATVWHVLTIGAE